MLSSCYYIVIHTQKCRKPFYVTFHSEFFLNAQRKRNIKIWIASLSFTSIENTFVMKYNIISIALFLLFFMSRCIWWWIKMSQLIFSRVLCDSTSPFVCLLVYLSYFTFFGFCGLWPHCSCPKLIKWPQLQPLPTRTQLG